MDDTSQILIRKYRSDNGTYRIIPYDHTYRDDMIFMVLQAKDALGRVPRLNEDLADVPTHFLQKGEGFWLAIDENDRVVGCMGYHVLPNAREVKLQRLYVKASRKRQGIGTALLQTVEAHLRTNGYTHAWVHLGGKEYTESRLFYPKQGYHSISPDHMCKQL